MRNLTEVCVHIWSKCFDSLLLPVYSIVKMAVKRQFVIAITSLARNNMTVFITIILSKPLLSDVSEITSQITETYSKLI